MKTVKAMAYGLCIISVFTAPSIALAMSDEMAKELLEEVKRLREEVSELKSNQTNFGSMKNQVGKCCKII